MLPVAVKVPVPGLYSSALARYVPLLYPPAISTIPLLSGVAVCFQRAVVMLPVVVKVPVAGLYSSALLRKPLLLCPPAISTIPLLSGVAVGFQREMVMLPVETKPGCLMVSEVEPETDP